MLIWEETSLTSWYSNGLENFAWQLISISPVLFDPIQDWEKDSPLENLSHMSWNDETWHSCTLPKEDPKNI